MSQNRYPSDMPVTLEDFRSSGWESIISSAEDYINMWSSFTKAAETAINDGRMKHGKVLWLLADVCSMMLVPNNFNNPFKPIAEFGTKRSALPQDFTDDDILFFSQIVEDINNHLLKGRISDIAWFRNRSLGIKFPLIAIDSYISIPLDTVTWTRVGRDCWRRAITLSKFLGAGAGDRLNQIEVAVFKALKLAKVEDGFLGIWLANLLVDNGLAKSKLSEIAEKIENLTKEFEQIGDNDRAQEYASTAAKIYNILKNAEKMAETMVCQAENIIKDAANKSKLAAIIFYEKAIQIYRAIPKVERSKYNGDTRISQLKELCTEAGNDSFAEMDVIETEKMDISQIVEAAEQSIRGKNTPEALLAFANLNDFLNYDDLKKRTIEQINQAPLHILFPSTTISKDGRVIAKHPGINPGDDNEQVIFFEMVKNYLISVGIAVQGIIWPAKRILYLEHRFCEQDIYSIVKQSPMTPIGRELLITKALYAGFENDFISCLHLLVPQIEHLVRYHLKMAGAKTTNLDINGIDNENGLSTLVELPEMAGIFGKGLTFELKALLCSSFGPNLRNETAHGLIGQDECFSAPSIYIWWLMFKIVFNTFWNLKNKAANKQRPSDNA